MRAEWLPVQLTLREAQALRLAATYASPGVCCRCRRRSATPSTGSTGPSDTRRRDWRARKNGGDAGPISGKQNAPRTVKIDPSAEKVSCWLVWALSHTGHTVLQAPRLTKTIAGRYHRVLRG